MRNIHHIFYSLLAFTMLLLMPSCSTEDISADEKDGTIQLILSNVQLQFSELYTGDELIGKLRLLIFNENGEIEKNELYQSGEPGFTNPFRTTVSTGIKNLCVIANETSGLSSQLSAVTSVRDLENMFAETITSDLALPLLMTGTLSSVNITSNKLYSQKVTLKRAAAKIVLNFKKDMSIRDTDVKITGVKLYKNAAKSILFPNRIILNQDQEYWDFMSTPATPIALGETAVGIPGKEAIYVYENLTEGDKRNATELELEVLYNNLPTTYRVYLNENVSAMSAPGNPSSSVTTPDDHLYSLQRNFEYRLTGTISGIGEFEGLTLNTKVLPWEYVPSNVAYDWGYTLVPHPTPAERIYTVNGVDESVSFTFTLKKPTNTRWVANLTNPTDFELVSVKKGGITEEEVTVTIRPRKEQALTERRTEFYINANVTGSIIELPLLKGSKEIGPDKRIVIKQAAK